MHNYLATETIRTARDYRGDMRRVWRTRHGNEVTVGMLLRFGNVTERVESIEATETTGEPLVTLKRRGMASRTTIRLSARQPYRVLVWADTGEPASL